MLNSMKKAGLLVAALISGSVAFAQRPVSVVTGNITSDRTFSSDTTYQLNGFVYVKSNATLTIEAGTIVQGYIDGQGTNTKGTLIITRDGYINAIGNECAPIVFTSAKAPGLRGAGDWGGVIILGEATINRGTDQGGYYTDVIEGGLTGDAADRTYGGNNDMDSSGVMQYCRIEFAGIAFTPNNEINSLTTGGVGMKTVIDHIQVSYAGDDAFENFGGTFNSSHLVAFRTLDDNFDMDQGYRGNIQWGIIYQEANTADISKSEGWENDNWKTNPNQSPRTAPVYSNITLVGPYATGTPNSLHQSAARIRRGAWTSIHNSVMVDHVNGLFIDGDDTYAGWNSGMEYKGNILAGMDAMYKASGTHTVSDMRTLWMASNDTMATTAMVGLPSDYNNINDPNLVPTAGSVLLSGADWTFTGASDFSQVSYRGAIGSNDWTANWTEFDPQNANYDNAAPEVTSIAAVNHNQGVYEATFSLPAGANRWFFQWRDENGSSWRTKGATNVNLTTQRFNITPWFNQNIEYRMGAVFGTDTALSCTETMAITNKSMSISTVEQNGPTCDADSALVRVGFAGGQGTKTILWSNGATTKRTYADQGETLSVTVTDETGYSLSDNITASTLGNTAAAPSNVQTSRSGTVVTTTFNAASLGAGQSLVGYRVQYRLRGTTSWTSTPLSTSTSVDVDFAGGTAGNYEFSAVTRYLDNGVGTTSARACFAVQGVPTTKNEGVNGVDAASTVAVYPNPANGELFVAATNGSEVSILDMNGRVLAQNTVANAEVSFDLSNIAAGAYMVRIVNGGDVTVEKFVKK